jgi:hypothetical protein
MYAKTLPSVKFLALPFFKKVAKKSKHKLTFVQANASLNGKHYNLNAEVMYGIIIWSRGALLTMKKERR